MRQYELGVIVSMRVLMLLQGWNISKSQHTEFSQVKSTMGQLLSYTSPIAKSTKVKNKRKNFVWKVRNWKAIIGSSKKQLQSPIFRFKNSFGFVLVCETVLDADGKCESLDFRLEPSKYMLDNGYFTVSFGGVPMICLKKATKTEVDDLWHNLDDASKIIFRLQEKLPDDINVEVEIVICKIV